MVQRRKRRRLTPDQVREIRRLVARGASQRKIIEQLGVSKGAIWWTLRARPHTPLMEW
jgi:DNA invertase Pin-like site-specific DNA recombinase